MSLSVAPSGIPSFNFPKAATSIPFFNSSWILSNSDAFFASSTVDISPVSVMVLFPVL